MMLFRTLSIVAFALCATATAQPPGTKEQPAKTTDKKDEVKKDEGRKDAPKPNDATQVKAFELKSANAGEVQQFLTRHFTPPTAAVSTKPGTPVPPPVAGKPSIQLAYDARTKVLFVRGSAADVETAGKMIAQLEGGAGAAGPLTVIHLRNTTADEVMKVLAALELNGKVHACPMSKALVLAPNDPNADQIKTVIERLDAAKAETKPEPKKN
jgi:hypothetical protein